MIPIFYGRGEFDGIAAFVLSEVHGIKIDVLVRSPDCKVSEDLLKTYLENVFGEFSKYSALYRDQKLDNFLLCDEGKVMVVDLEQVEFPAQRRDWHHFINKEGARYLMGDLAYIQRPKRESSPLALWMPVCDSTPLDNDLAEFNSGRANFRGSIGGPSSTAA